MTLSHKITLALALALAAVLAIAAHGWISEHEARAVLQTQQADAKATLAALDAKEKSNQAELAAQLDRFAQMKAQVQTPRQVVQALPSVMPVMPVPITQVTDAQAKAAAQSQASGLPDAPGSPSSRPLAAGDLIIPAADAKAFYDAQVDCKANEAKVASCAQTVATQKDEIATKDKLIADQVKALKGGSNGQRTKRALFWAAVGGAAVYVASRIHH